MSSWRFQPIVTLAAVSVLILTIVACDHQDSTETYFDVKFSAQLALPGDLVPDPASRVSHLEAYIGTQESRDVISLEEVHQLRQLLETSDAATIRSFVAGAGEATSGSCNPFSTADVVHIVAFDKDRASVVGSLRVFPCANTEDVAVMAYGSRSIVYSKTLRRSLEAIGVGRSEP